MTQQTPETIECDGLVLYPDGSCKGANPGGWLGYGVHGFAYNTAEPKKGAGNPKYVPTKDGYCEKTYPNIKPVTMVKYFDVIGSPEQTGSNNTAEILAANSAMELAAKYSPKKVLIKTDSNYVVKGLNEWSTGWVKRGWRKPDGSPIPNAQEWRDLLASTANLTAQGIKVEIKHVAGHSTHLGNNIADKLAGIGSEINKSGKAVTIVNSTAPEGYWKTQEERSTMLAYRTMIFSTMKSTQHRGEYFLSTIGKSDELVGKANVNTSYAVVQLKRPEPVIEMIRERQNALVDYVDHLVLARLDRIYSGNIADDLIRYGENCLTLSSKPGKGPSKHLFFITEAKNGEPLTEELNPPMLASRAMVAMASLKEILEFFKAGLIKDMSVTDITDNFYNTVEKKVGKEVTSTQELKKEINVTSTKIKVKANSFGRNVEISLTYGLDIPPRNNLKRFAEEGVTKVSLVCHKESDLAYRYHTVIQVGDNWSIWSGFYSNLLLFGKTEV